MAQPTTKMSVTRALRKLKTLDKRIAETELETMVVGKSTNQDEVKKTATECEQTAQKLMDLFNNRMAIKSVIVNSNANTKVRLDSLNTEVTVAEAIEMKRLYEDTLFPVLRKAELFRMHMRERYDNAYAQVEKKADRFVEGDGEKSENTNELVKEYINDHKPLMEEPKKAMEVYDKLKKLSDEVVDEIDYKLSEVNATTQVEVPTDV